MSDGLPQVVERIRALSPRLAAAAEEADRLAGVVERFLAEECRAALPVEVAVRCDDRQRVATLGLGYQALNGQFRVVVITRDPAAGDRPAAVSRHWKQAALGDRLAALPLLPSLLRAVERAMAAQLKAAGDASAAAADILRAMGVPSLEVADDVFKPAAVDGTRRFIPSKALLPARPREARNTAAPDTTKPTPRRGPVGAGAL